MYSSTHPCIIVACGQLFTRAAHEKRFSSRTRRDYTKKLKNVAVVAAALALAVGMTACGGSASSTTASSAASSVASSAAASSEAASSEAASSEAEVEPAEYTVYNTTGENVTDLYLYVAGSEDKGENLAADGLADGDSVVLTLPEDADKSAEYVLEFTTESGDTQSFDTLSYEVAPISLLSVDAAAGATPISFTAPEQ